MLNRRASFVLFAAGSFLVGVVACSSDADNPAGSSTSSSSSSSSSSSGGSSTSSSGGSVDSGAEGGTLVSGCRSFEDRTAASADRTLPWGITTGFDIANIPERCMKIKVGQSIRFKGDNGGDAGDFISHPLIAATGGDSPNPFSAQIDTNTGVVDFPNAGTFGFKCSTHFTSMVGAVLVVP